MVALDQVETSIEEFPLFIQPLLKNTWEKILNYYSSSHAHFWPQNSCPWSEEFINDLLILWSRSDYAAESSARYPGWLSVWYDNDAFLSKTTSENQYEERLRLSCQLVATENEFMHVLRLFRREQMLRILWRDLLGKVSLDETMRDVTALADGCIRVSLEYLYSLAIEKYGVPMCESLPSPNSKSLEERQLIPQKLIVLGMGKLGARELNVSSDVDLIFVYPESGMTKHKLKPIENHQFFVKLAQRLIYVLDQTTAEGFVFRVDMRLRPYGDSGELVLNFAALEDYFQNQGREWERFAMIKARPITGEPEHAKILLDIIHPFVYRKYTDFTSFQALREMKRLIKSEVHRKGGDQNIKLGRGGIREIEFIVQACQLIYGGRELNLQHTGLIPVLRLLGEHRHLPDKWIDQLLEAYRFLRRLEHAIQGLGDQQTQLIPSTENERNRVSWSLGFNSWREADEELFKHRAKVSQIFKEFLHESENQEQREGSSEEQWLHLWQAEAKPDQWIAVLTKAGYELPLRSYKSLMELKGSRLYGAMSSSAKQRFEQFLPLLLEVAKEYPDPSKTLDRVLSFVQVVLGRTVYLVLLCENMEALKQLCLLCSASPWVAEHLVKSPVILDELIDRKNLYTPPEKADLQDELRQQLLRIPEDDLETQLDCLRTFKQSHMLRVAAAEIGGQLPLMKVSDYLTWLAEAILVQTVHIAWQNLTAKHGRPSGASGSKGSMGFAVIAYGKLGGIELNYGSDLDMVFLYDTDNSGMTLGHRAINNQIFYTRLGQRVIHILSTQTTHGRLYEADMRLRPSGNSGMLVTSIAAYEKYQQQDAWTWEHQALVRARFVAGDPQLGQRFKLVRNDILTMERDQSVLRKDVLKMRNKMRQAAIDSPNKKTEFRDDLKQGEGGLVDIEFITQLGVLQSAHRQPELLAWTDNIRLLKALAEYNCMGGVDVFPLLDAYRKLRSALHRKNLADKDYRAEWADFSETRMLVKSIWAQIFNDPIE